MPVPALAVMLPALAVMVWAPGVSGLTGLSEPGTAQSALARQRAEASQASVLPYLTMSLAPQTAYAAACLAAAPGAA